MEKCSLSAEAVVEEVLQYWEKAWIPIKAQDHVKTKVLGLYKTWNAIKKNQKRITGTQKRKEEKFKEEMKDLFDIAHKDALSLMKNEEDKHFIFGQ
ncbi:hypothetical protein Pcinc_012691 [Petrolisthes cinctipes]|uniref:Uncharacterized protein n=1 Tax=Petrolisthes cinctipes TaxID=88211 RepID=A0AAE1KV40_PETCI|nr:hypothetical protein Pcinc_012691 [Petrolisthes cinctipes]